MNFRIPRLLAIVLAAALAVACTPGGGSIYFTLEGEVKVEDNTLPNKITVFDVAKIGSTYYAAGGKIWDGDISGAVGERIVSWNTAEPLPVASPSATALCTALVLSPFDGTKLYGAFFDDGEADTGLYLSSAAPSFAGTSAETLPVAGSQIALLKLVNNGADRLVAVTTWQQVVGEEMVFVYGIVYSATAGSYAAATFDATRLSGEESKSINDVVWAGAPLSAWFATEGTKLYTNSTPDMSGDFTLAGMTGITTDKDLTGLFFDGTRLYVASRNGSVFHSTNGTTWTEIAAPDISGSHPPLTRFAGTFGTSDVLLVGSDGYGYYSLPTNPLGALSRFDNTTINLHTASVRSLVLDTVEGLVLALTSMDGLWRGTVSGDAIVEWGQE